ncbi:MAG: ABC transporter ATP-binding protein [Acidobacteriota bacterium]
MSDRVPALRLRGLRVRYPRSHGRHATAVDGLDLEIAAGEAVGLLGESGSGKSSLALAATGLLGRGSGSTTTSSVLVEGAIEVAGQRVDGFDERAWRRLRGATVGIVFQQPGLALHPLRRVGAQVVEVLRAHRRGSRAECRDRARASFADLGLDADCFDAYPHQLSGGQRQRVVLAQALVCEPSLLVADEATASLDPKTASAVLDRLDELRRRRRLAILWIDHDADRIARLADRVQVLYAGRWAEQGPARDVLATPRHPYLRALLACRPGADGAAAPAADRRLPCIPGSAPSADAVPTGCAFAERCPERFDRCLEQPPPHTIEHRTVWCFAEATDG